MSSRQFQAKVGLLLAAALAGCDRTPSDPRGDPSPTVAVCRSNAAAPAAYTPEAPSSGELGSLGLGAVADRYTSELAVHGGYGYTGTWGKRAASGNVLNVFDLRGAAPALVRGIPVSDSVATLGDVQVSDDGRLLFVATEFAPHGSLRVYDLADPANPTLLSTFRPSGTANGVHTAEIARVGGRLYGFLSIDPSPSRLVVVDLSDPARPVEVLSRAMGNPFIHDVFVRDGILFTALWNDGLAIWDIGGCGSGSPANPVRIGSVATAGGKVHNVWWYHSPGGGKRYAFVGEEGPGVTGVRASGDLHVVDLTDMSSPHEVAFYHLEGAGAHNFSMDEERGILFVAFYNGGVRALDVRGDLGACTAAQRSGDGRCDLGAMGREIGHWLTGASPGTFVWGVQWAGGSLYASDMLNGLHRLDTSRLRR